MFFVFLFVCFNIRSDRRNGYPTIDFSLGNDQLVIHFLHSLMKSLLRAFYLLDLGDADVSRANILSSLIKFRFYPGKYILSKCVHILMIFISLVVCIIKEKNSMFLAMETDLD